MIHQHGYDDTTLRKARHGRNTKNSPFKKKLHQLQVTAAFWNGFLFTEFRPGCQVLAGPM